MQINATDSQNATHNQSDSVHALIMAMMGVDRLAYIKTAQADSFTVFAADGTPLADFDTQQEAYESILRHNLTPVRLH